MVFEDNANSDRSVYQFGLPVPLSLNPNTVYTVTIPTTTRNTFGQELGGTDLTFTFTTGS
jgi:hypothetical protein